MCKNHSSDKYIRKEGKRLSTFGSSSFQQECVKTQNTVGMGVDPDYSRNKQICTNKRVAWCDLQDPVSAEHLNLLSLNLEPYHYSKTL